MQRELVTAPLDEPVKRADVYAPNTTFEFEVTNLTAEQAKSK